MKKMTSLLVILFITISFKAQTLNQSTTWPNQTWTIEGTYNAANLVANPTTDASSFKYDDAQVAHTGDIIYLKSPVINLEPAFIAKEKGLKISFSLAFATTSQTTEMIGLQYWDADSNLWHFMPKGTPQPGDSMGDYLLCTTAQIDLYFDFAAFTTNQLQNFRYRFFYNDGGLSQGKGICLLAPSILSVSCNDTPTNLVASNLGSTFVNIGWTAVGNESAWQMEYGAAGYTVGSGTKQDTNQNPSGIGDLSPQTSYDAYVRADCVPNNNASGGELFSPWSSKVNFTTTAAATCMEPSGNIFASNITSNSIKIVWTTMGNERSYNVEVGKTGYTRGSNFFFNWMVTQPNAEAGGLSPNTTYDFYIQSNCGNQSLSSWAGPFTYTTSAQSASIGWANLQWPGTGTINLGDKFTVYAQVYSTGITDKQGPGNDMRAWIGYSVANSNPNTWTNWVEASYNTDAGNNDEYMADLGSVIPVDGDYFYASRFQIGQDAYSYGGFSLGGGNFWDGFSYTSGELTINRTASQWSAQHNPLGAVTLGKVQFVSANEGWVTVMNGQLLHTLDAGANWTVVDPSPLVTDWIVPQPAGAMFWLNPTHGWYVSTFGTDINSSMGAILNYTTDGGVNWTSKVIDNTARVLGVQVQFFDANNGWLSTFNSNTLIGNGYVSTDGGANWTSNGSDSDGGVMYFLDANNGWKASSVNDAPPHNISHTTDGGSHWTTQYTDNTTGVFNAIQFVDANNGWVVGDNEKILKTTDGGVTWTPIINTGLPVGGNNFTAIFFSNVNVGRIAAGGDDNRNSSILYTANGGTTWEIQALALPPSIGKSNSNSASKTQINTTADIFSIYFVDELNGWYVADNGQITHTTGDPLSIQQNNLNAIDGFRFYPNPAQDQLMLNANQKIDQVEVYNLLGQQLMLVKPNVSSYQLKLNTIKSGLYFIKVKTNGKTGTYKVLKQ